MRRGGRPPGRRVWAALLAAALLPIACGKVGPPVRSRPAVTPKAPQPLEEADRSDEEREEASP